MAATTVTNTVLHKLQTMHPIAQLKLLGIALALFVTACGGGNGTSQPQTTRPPEMGEGLLGPGDIFEVRVYGEKELSGEHRVGPDGTIDYPFIGAVEVAGLAPRQVSDKIAQLLKDNNYLKAPQVSVFVKDYQSKRVSVTGAVQKDGNFPITSGLTVVEAISLAGGFTPLASRNDVVVTRREGQELKRYRVRVEDITEGRSEDFVLQPGDIIYVPERLF